MQPPQKGKLKLHITCLRLGLLAALILAGCTTPETPTPSPSPPAIIDCALPPLADPLTAGWRFRTDPDDAGLDGQWFDPAFDDTLWQALAPGEPWEFSGLEYDGVAWYRTRITLPDWPAVYLGFGGVDDAATLWIDGREIETWEGLGTRPALLNLRQYGAAGDVLTLAFRIEDRGGYGGLKQPLRLGAEPRTVMTRQQYAIWLADAHPEWPMPRWALGQPYAWTMAGLRKGSSLLGTPMMARPPGFRMRRHSRRAVLYSGKCSIVPML